MMVNQAKQLEEANQVAEQEEQRKFYEENSLAKSVEVDTTPKQVESLSQTMAIAGESSKIPESLVYELFDWCERHELDKEQALELERILNKYFS